MMTRRAMLMLLACSADAFGQGISSRSVRPQPRGKPSGRPFVARFTDVGNSRGAALAEAIGQVARPDPSRAAGLLERASASPVASIRVQVVQRHHAAH